MGNKENWSTFLDYAQNWKNEVCIFGAGECGEKWGYKLLKEAGFNLVYYVDNNKKGGECNGLQIKDPIVLNNNEQILCIVTANSLYCEDIINQLKLLKVKNFFVMPNWESYIKELPQVIDETNNEELKEKFKYIMDDEQYLIRRYAERLGKTLNLEHPRTFNEKLQWLKIHNRNPLYTTLVDKYEVKNWVEKKIGKQYVVPLYGVWNSVEDIDISSLPDKFVLKTTHSSEGVICCEDKNRFDLEKAKKELAREMQFNAFYADREWPYKNVEPKIIAEEYLESLGKPDSIEYKLTTFNGKVKFVTICRGIAHSSLDARTNDHFDIDFNRLPFYVFYKNSNINFKKPAQWEKMIELAEILAKDIPTVRVDFYIENGKIFFGEMTFYTWSGCNEFVPEDYDDLLGSWLDLSGLVN